MKTSDFFTQYPVFTSRQFREFQESRGSHSQWTRKALLAHYEKQHRIRRIRRGLYAVSPSGLAGGNEAIDPYLVAGQLAPDAVLGYHTALSVHGRAHSVSDRFEFLTATHARPTTLNGWHFRPVLFPPALSRKDQTTYGVQTAERSGQTIRVTSLERTLVDVLDRPDLGGGWEEIWRSLESIEFFNLDQVIEYAILLDNATTVSKVGFFLEQHQESLMVEASHLDRLRQHRPAQPHYLSRQGRGKQKLMADWNLIVPLPGTKGQTLEQIEAGWNR